MFAFISERLWQATHWWSNTPPLELTQSSSADAEALRTEASYDSRDLSDWDIISLSEYQSPEAYRSESTGCFRQFARKAAAASGVPNFLVPKINMRANFPELANAGKQGEQLLDVVNALFEVAHLAKKHKGKSFCQSSLLSTAKRFVHDSLDPSKKEVSLSGLSNEILLMLNNDLSEDVSSIDGYNIEKLTELLESGELSDATDINTYLLFAMKSASYCLKHKIKLTPSVTAFHDLELANHTTNDPFIFLNLKPEQFERWQETLNAGVPEFFDPHLALGRFSFNALKELNHFLWCKHKLTYILEGGSHRFNRSVMQEYIAEDWLPTKLQRNCFSSPVRHGMSANSSVDKPVHISPTSLEENVTFGEELEYFIPKTGDKVTETDLLALMREWHGHLENILEKNNITPDQVTGLEALDYTKELFVKVGDWSCVVFRDGDAVEVNSTPNTLNQRFTITMNGEKRQLTSYECYDLFVHPIVQKMKLQRFSGHKHFDARPLHGNSALLCRFVVDMEENSWLARAIGRDDQAKFFPHTSEIDATFSQQFPVMIKAFNEQLARSGDTPHSSDFAHIHELQSLMLFLGLFQKNSSCSLHHIKEAEHTAELITSPTSTVELRQFHCPKSGRESELINKLILGRLNYLLKCQTNNKPLPTELPTPGEYEQCSEEVIARKAIQYIRECGLEPADYEEVLSITVPDSCKHLLARELSEA